MASAAIPFDLNTAISDGTITINPLNPVVINLQPGSIYQVNYLVNALESYPENPAVTVSAYIQASIGIQGPIPLESTRVIRSITESPYNLSKTSLIDTRVTSTTYAIELIAPEIYFADPVFSSITICRIFP